MLSFTETQVIELQEVVSDLSDHEALQMIMALFEKLDDDEKKDALDILTRAQAGDKADVELGVFNVEMTVDVSEDEVFNIHRYYGDGQNYQLVMNACNELKALPSIPKHLYELMYRCFRIAL